MPSDPPSDPAAPTPPLAWEIPGAPVRGYRWPAPQERGAVLLLHGFGEYAQRYVERYHALIPALTAAGWTVYGYDQRGHGESPGRRATVSAYDLLADHFAARAALRERGVSPLFAYGHSLGGLITLASAARDPRGLSGVILSSPALTVGEDQPAPLRRAAPLLGRLLPGLPVAKLDNGMLSRVADETEAYRQDAGVYQGQVPALTAGTMTRLSAELWRPGGPFGEPPSSRFSLPLLVLHGEADRLTPIGGSERLMARLAGREGDWTFRRYPGGYHELLNDTCRDEVRAATLDWLDAHAQKGSGNQGGSGK